MAITQNLMSLDAYFRSTPGPKLFVNDLSYFSKEADEELNSKLKTVYDHTDVLSTKPTCECGKFTGRYLVGKVCPYCKSEVKEFFSQVYPVLWLKSLSSEYRFLNPTYWLMVSYSICKFKTIDALRWLSDSRYNPNMLKIPDELYSIREHVLGGVRNYRTTMEKLPNILRYLAELPKNKNSSKKKVYEELLEVYYKYQDILFSDHLPIINKKLFVVESTSKGKYVNIISADTIDVVKTWQKLCSQENISEIALSNTTAAVVSKLAGLYLAHYSKFVVAKNGIFRKNVYGAKSHFAFRCVVVSIPGRHRFDEIIAPWIVGLTTFRPHVLNKLVRRGYSYKDASKKIFKAANKFDQEIYDILEELIAETPGGRGIPIISQRNPSLKTGSALLCYLTKFRKDVTNFTCGVSILVVKCQNADFDGDELNFTVLLDGKLANEFDTMAPWFSVPGASRPYAITNLISLLSPSNSILSNYLLDKSVDPKEKDTVVSRMEFKTVTM